MTRWLALPLICLAVAACDKLERKPSVKPATVTNTTVVTVSDIAGGDVQKLSLGEDHSCALFGDGSVACWGGNGRGQLGFDPEQLASSATPVTPDGDVLFSDIAAGKQITCGIDEKTAHVLCWGSNIYGELGLKATNQKTSFAPVVIEREPGKPIEKATHLFARYGRVCAITENEIVCWGKAHYVVAKEKPTTGAPTGEKERRFEWLEQKEMAKPVLLNSSSLEQEKWGPAWTPNILKSLVLLENDTCALVEEKVRCLKNPAGDEDFVSLQSDRDRLFLLKRDRKDLFYANLRPNSLLDIELYPNEWPRGEIQVYPGHRHTCFSVEKDATYCFGNNEFGQLGFKGEGEDKLYRLDVTNVLLAASGTRHSCAVSGNKVVCWGDNSSHQCGN